MKIFIFSLLTFVGLMLVGLQHQQIGHLREENSTLEQAAAEADQLKTDLAKSVGQAQDATEEIARLREENHDLLKLRNEVNQLRDTRAEFQRVSAENERLRSQPRATPQPAVNQMLIQPIVINVNALYDRGFNTPEDAVQTFLWAERDRNIDAMSRCVLAERWPGFRQRFENHEHTLDGIVSIEIVARRDLNPAAIQLGIRLHAANSESIKKIIIELTRLNGEWK